MLKRCDSWGTFKRSSPCGRPHVWSQFLWCSWSAPSQRERCNAHATTAPLMAMASVARPMTSMGLQTTPSSALSFPEVQPKSMHTLHESLKVPCCRCNKTSAPAWCSDSWCYVQASSCTVTHEMSTSIPGLAWSYTTCGFRDRFSRSNITESLRGQTLRVQFLGNTGGWKGNYCPGFAGQPCHSLRRAAARS